MTDDRPTSGRRESVSQAATDGHPLFAFGFRAGRGTPLPDLAAFDAAPGTWDFLWAHFDLRDPAAQAWLHARPWPPDVIEAAAAPIQRGRLFILSDMIYGHLRDFRDEGVAPALQPGSLCVVASGRFLVTGRRIPLLAIEDVRRRVESSAVLPESPFGLITEFFKALNDIGEDLLQEAGDRLRAIRVDVLKPGGARRRDAVLELRRDSIEVARDMAYKRSAMLELARDRPAPFPASDYDRFTRQIHRYAALTEDVQDYAEHCQFLLEEVRAQVAEDTNRNIYILTLFSAVFLPATVITGMWGMNVGGIPFADSPHGFWVVGGLIAAFFALFGVILLRFVLKIF